MVIWRYYQDLPSVTFVVDHQEQTLEHESSIQKAWLKIALSDYRNEFVKVYEFFNYMGRKENIQIKNKYNEESYFSKNATSLVNIKEKYLDLYNLVTSHSPLFLRYVKYLFDNIQEYPSN